MRFIDTHVHLMMPDYHDVGGVGAVLQRAQAAGVTYCVVPGIDYQTSQQAIALAATYPAIIPAVGLHPMNPDEDLTLYKALAARPEVKAIGEIGTDARANDLPGGWPKQEQRFRFFLDLAQQVDKPALVHVIRTWDETVAILADYPQLRGKVVLHCFAAGPAEAKKIRDLGLLISCTALIARNGMQSTLEVIKDWPLNQMMLETDGPWLKWPKGEKSTVPNEPTTVAQIAQCVADVKGISVEAVAQATTQTAQTFFSL
jgi:TatD DNase family protein